MLLLQSYTAVSETDPLVPVNEIGLLDTPSDHLVKVQLFWPSSCRAVWSV